MLQLVTGTLKGERSAATGEDTPRRRSKKQRTMGDENVTMTATSAMVGGWSQTAQGQAGQEFNGMGQIVDPVSQMSQVS